MKGFTNNKIIDRCYGCANIARSMNPGTAVICAVVLAALAIISAAYCALKAYRTRPQPNVKLHSYWQGEMPKKWFNPYKTLHSKYLRLNCCLQTFWPILTATVSIPSLIACVEHSTMPISGIIEKGCPGRLEQFIRSYALPDRGNEESVYSYLGKCVRAISKEQRRIIGLPVFKETNLLKALQLIEECEEKIPDPILNQFCRAIQIDKFYLPGAVIDHRLLTRPSSDLSCKNLSK